MKNWILLLFVSVATATWGQDGNLRMRFDFTDVKGTSVSDALSGITAKTVSPAKVIEMGPYHVLSLGAGSGYLNLTADAGALLASMNNFTLSAYYRIGESASLSGNGYFLWACSTLASNTATAAAYTTYRLNAQRVASATAGYDTEKGYEVGTPSQQGSWVHVAYTQTGTTGRLYVNGRLQGSVSGMPRPSTLFAATKPGSCWVGRAPFSGDSYLRNTLVYDFRLYDCALTASDILTLSAETVALDNAYIHGSQGITTALETTLANARALLDAPDGYLPDALRELSSMVALAETVVAGGYSQAYIDQTRTRLNMLISAVKASKGIVLPDLAALQQAYDRDRGFIHPGGLHTQADFDRVKQLLADKDATVTRAYNVLKSAAYSQSSVGTSPVETIVRGGGSGENYINAARGATMAYQNALRWKIDGTRANAEAAVRILMAWANTTKHVTGNSDAILALGLYGYQFAQAAELMRDYEGWSREDFQTFKRWMMTVWYPGAVTFLRFRNGTWENGGKWWQAPGHYWSNWGLCCALCVASIGVLCDDVYVYNQGMSFFKYDQVGNFTIPPVMHAVTGHSDFTGEAIWNDALTEFMGALVVTDVESPLETGAYGRLGQMQESGRDTGHSAMALGLAVDLAKLGWNQGDDLFAYMDHRLASGIEYVAAQTQSLEGLPWTPYQRCESGFYYTDYRSWVMQGPALGAQIRPYWGTVIGIYEGVKGVKMPFSDVSYNTMGIDGGGQGGTSGGYDHMGYSVLMNTRVPRLAPQESVPTELKPLMEYSGTLTSLVPSPAVETRLGNLSGKTFRHNELGGLVNKYDVIGGSVPNGQTLRLVPQLPEGEEDTGRWQWNTGEQTREITVPTDRSFVYRVTYTNKNGVESQLCFPIACESDGTPIELTPSIVCGGTSLTADTLSVLYGETPTLSASPTMGGGKWRWSSGETTQSLTTAPLTSDRRLTLFYTHTSGVPSAQTFRLGVHRVEPFILHDGKRTDDSELVLDAGASVMLGVRVPAMVDGATVRWTTGDTGNLLTLSDLQTSTTVTATFLLDGETVEQTFTLYVKEAERSRLVEPGQYLIEHVPSARLLTSNGASLFVTFEEGDPDQPSQGQVWYVDRKDEAKYNIISLPDSLKLNVSAKAVSAASYPYYFYGAQGADRVAIYTGSTSSTQKFWSVDAVGTVVLTQSAAPTAFPFRLRPFSGGNAVVAPHVDAAVVREECFDLAGRPVRGAVQKGVTLRRKVQADGTVTVTKQIGR